MRYTFVFDDADESARAMIVKLEASDFFFSSGSLSLLWRSLLVSSPRQARKPVCGLRKAKETSGPCPSTCQ